MTEADAQIIAGLKLGVMIMTVRFLYWVGIHSPFFACFMAILALLFIFFGLFIMVLAVVVWVHIPDGHYLGSFIILVATGIPSFYYGVPAFKEFMNDKNIDLSFWRE